jgi:NAD(P)-dependent dehydrogenase (short-subunit alcohol dehydrogenase family)
MTFSGKTVLITGAGSGIGRAMAELFLAQEARVIGVDVDAERIADTARELDGLVPVVTDIATSAGADEAVAAADGKLDVLCNNAGVLDRLALADEVTEAEWDRVIAVNLTAPFLLSRRALPIMIGLGGGAIVNTASMAGLRGGRSGTAYTASKFGLIGLTQNIASTFGKHGIRCNAICPGPVATGLATGVTPDAVKSERGAEMIAMRFAAGDPIPRAQPEEVAGVAVFLASDAAARINGVAVPVESGWLTY